MKTSKKDKTPNPIRLLRQKKGWSQYQLAKALSRAGYKSNQTDISTFETGVKVWEPKKVKVATTLLKTKKAA